MGKPSKKQPVAVGIDVSAKKLDVAVQAQDEVRTFDNTPNGHKALVKALTKGGRYARVVVEATSTYHLDLAVALAEHDRCEVMVANPRTTKHFHQAQNRRAKTDKVDARSLCAFAATMAFTPWSIPGTNVLELRALGRRVGQLVKHQTRLKNQLHAAEITARSPGLLIQDIREELEQLAERIARIKKQMLAMARADERMQALVASLSSIPGIGTDTAVQLMAEFILLDPEMTSKEITAWAGLDPMPRESGTSQMGKRSISKRGNGRARAALYMPALTASRMEGTPMRDLYARVEKSTSVKMKGITAVMRKLLVVSWCLFRTCQHWDATKASQRKHEVASAA